MFNFSALRQVAKSNKSIFTAAKTYGKMGRHSMINSNLLSTMGRASGSMLGRNKNLSIGVVNKIGKAIRGI